MLIPGLQITQFLIDLKKFLAPVYITAGSGQKVQGKQAIKYSDYDKREFILQYKKGHTSDQEGSQKDRVSCKNAPIELSDLSCQAYSYLIDNWIMFDPADVLMFLSKFTVAYIDDDPQKIQNFFETQIISEYKNCSKYYFLLPRVTFLYQIFSLIFIRNTGATGLDSMYASGVCISCHTLVNQTMTCSKCKIVLYCSKECQIADWPIHRPDCLFDSLIMSIISIDEYSRKTTKKCQKCTAHERLQETANPRAGGVQLQETANTQKNTFADICKILETTNIFALCTPSI